jgi:hypothetical protein
LTINGRPYASVKYEDILKEQLLIAYLSKGAITITETSNMPINDRKILLNTLRQAEDAKKKRLEELKEQRKLSGLRNKKK